MQLIVSITCIGLLNVWTTPLLCLSVLSVLATVVLLVIGDIVPTSCVCQISPRWVHGWELDRGVNLVGNLGGQWQTAFGSKPLPRKTGRVKTSDTVQDKNKNVYIITGQLKLKHICAIFWGDTTYYPPRHSTFFFGGGGRDPLSPSGFTPLELDISSLKQFPGQFPEAVSLPDIPPRILTTSPTRLTFLPRDAL